MWWSRVAGSSLNVPSQESPGAQRRTPPSSHAAPSLADTWTGTAVPWALSRSQPPATADTHKPHLNRSHCTWAPLPVTGLKPSAPQGPSGVPRAGHRPSFPMDKPQPVGAGPCPPVPNVFSGTDSNISVGTLPHQPTTEPLGTLSHCKQTHLSLGSHVPSAHTVSPHTHRTARTIFRPTPP